MKLYVHAFVSRTLHSKPNSMAEHEEQQRQPSSSNERLNATNEKLAQIQFKPKRNPRRISCDGRPRPKGRPPLRRKWTHSWWPARRRQSASSRGVWETGRSREGMLRGRPQRALSPLGGSAMLQQRRCVGEGGVSPRFRCVAWDQGGGLPSCLMLLCRSRSSRVRVTA